MIGTNETELLKNGNNKIWIIWCALFYSLFIFIYLCQKFPDIINLDVGENFPIDLLKYILFGVTAVEFCLIPFIRKKVLSVGAADASAATGNNASQPNLKTVTAKYGAAVIVSSAMAVCFAVYGFVLFHLGAGYNTLYIFVGIAAVAMIFSRPKLNELKDYYTSFQAGSSIAV